MAYNKNKTTIGANPADDDANNPVAPENENPLTAKGQKTRMDAIRHRAKSEIDNAKIKSKNKNKGDKGDENAPKTTFKKRGSCSMSNYTKTDATAEDICLAVHHVFQYFERRTPRSDEECEQRIIGYFEDCYDQQMVPTIEGLALALGTVRQTLSRWENGVGCTIKRSYLIRKAKQVLAATDAELVNNGKIPQVVYIFRSKNFYGMSDQQEITVTAGGPEEQTMSADDIAKRYIEDGKSVETTFTDGKDNDE